MPSVGSDGPPPVSLLNQTEGGKRRIKKRWDFSTKRGILAFRNSTFLGAALEWWRAIMPAQLIALDYGPSILLDKPILLLGRHPECDIQIDSRKISRRHCCIAQVSDYLVVRDLGSTNGIRINGIRIVEGKLSAGDELTIGNHRYKVAWDEEDPGPVVPQSSAQSLSPPDRGPKAEGRSPKRASRDPSPVEDIEDEMLESCDEPVALDESDEQGLPIALPAQPPAPESPLPKKDNPLYLPDELRLMPHSDLFRKGSPLASPSGSQPPA